MDFNKAVERVNNIDWDKRKGKSLTPEEIELFTKYINEYLKKFAKYCKKEKIGIMNGKYNPPYFISLSSNTSYTEKLLDEKMEILKYCSDEIRKRLVHGQVAKVMIMEYLHLAKMSDNENVQERLDILEPMIKLIEEGILLTCRTTTFTVYKIGEFNLKNWVEEWSDCQELILPTYPTMRTYTTNINCHIEMLNPEEFRLQLIYYGKPIEY